MPVYGIAYMYINHDVHGEDTRLPLYGAFPANPHNYHCKNVSWSCSLYMHTMRINLCIKHKLGQPYMYMAALHYFMLQFVMKCTISLHA